MARIELNAEKIEMTKQVITHVCAKESEIVKIAANMENMDKKIDEIHRHIVGNGRPGLLERVSNIEVGSRVLYAIVVVAITTFGILIAI